MPALCGERDPVGRESAGPAEKREQKDCSLGKLTA